MNNSNISWIQRENEELYKIQIKYRDNEKMTDKILYIQYLTHT